jgi:regulator of cell morphogenesis and NO signaling
MTELNTRSLAQIVNANHKAASVFEKYNLDFCCKGKRSLQQACSEQNISVDKLLSELQNISAKDQAAFPFDKLPLSELADFIISAHHAYVKIESPQILSYLQKVAFKHGQRHPEMNKVFELFSAVKEEMEEHMQKEELILFPRIRAVEGQTAEKKELKVNIAYLQSPIRMMEEEHEHAGSLMKEIRQLTNNYTAPEDACTTHRLSLAALQAFEQDLHQHVHLENNILFPKALALFKQISAEALN